MAIEAGIRSDTRAHEELLHFVREAGRQQVDLALEWGIPQQTLSRVLRGGCRPSIRHALAIEIGTGGRVPVASWVTEAELVGLPREIRFEVVRRRRGGAAFRAPAVRSVRRAARRRGER